MKQLFFSALLMYCLCLSVGEANAATLVYSGAFADGVGNGSFSGVDGDNDGFLSAHELTDFSATVDFRNGGPSTQGQVFSVSEPDSFLIGLLDSVLGGGVVSVSATIDLPSCYPGFDCPPDTEVVFYPTYLSWEFDRTTKIDWGVQPIPLPATGGLAVSGLFFLGALRGIGGKRKS